MSKAATEVLTPAALDFVAELELRFRSTRAALLDKRREVQKKLDSGWRPDFLRETRTIRDGDWSIAELPSDLLDRRVEITGPVDRKMIINALNSGANVFMADFEDSTAPIWENVVEGQVNLRDAVRRTIEYENPKTGKLYRLGEKPAVLFVRPRGWHLDEKHVLVDGSPVSASIFDFALFFFWNAQELIDRGTGPYFYLPKLENHLEARLWNEVFLAAQAALGLPSGTIKATVLIENVLAAFEMDEILFELRRHSAGLNCGRWDYIFSFIKKFRNDSRCVLPDRGTVGMDRHFLQAYRHLLIKTCHRRGAHAMGGMAAQIPIKGDDEANAKALAAVAADKRAEAAAGHDGTWVAHPGLVGIALREFDAVLGDRPNQIENLRSDVEVGSEDLLRVPAGSITTEGLRQNLDVGVLYLEAWLRGSGCVPLYNLMEDAATAEISRTQVWQWVKHGARLEDGRVIDIGLVRRTLKTELDGIVARIGEESYRAGKYELAASVFLSMIEAPELPEWLTLAGYRHLS